MKLTFSPASPFAGKVRIAAIETGLIDKPNSLPRPSRRVRPRRIFEDHAAEEAAGADPRQWRRHLDSYVIVEYLDELAGGGKLIPASARAMESEERPLPAEACSIPCCCAATRAWCGRSRAVEAWSAITGTARGPAWRASRTRPNIVRAVHISCRSALFCVRGLCRFRFGRLRLAQGLSEARRLPPEDDGTAVGENLGTAGGVTIKAEDSGMREGGKRLRRLGFAAFLMLAAYAAAAQAHNSATGQRNLACGSPASIGDGWPTATTGKRRPRW